MTDESERRGDFYAVKYASFGSEAAAALRREIFGDDIGQEGWSTAAEHTEIAGFLDIGPTSHVLDVCCGSGGPSLALTQRTGCRLTGIDREEAAIAYAQAQALSRALAGRATFALADCSKPLPFEDGSFDALLCIDAVLHLRDRFGTLREWARLLRDGGRLAFTDIAVITGEITKSELDTAPPVVSSCSSRPASMKRP
jgi:ubiquinone/menaquinone biosynthesis C-methylase UbiE